jgi:hypothetical protein
MLHASPRPAAMGGKPRDIWLHGDEPAEALDATLARTVAGLELRPGFPERILELEDVFVVPGEGTSCLYDKDGRRIAESCVRRGENLDDYIGAEKERIDPPTDFAVVSTPVLYLSMYFRHWGHFLTEAVSRLWPRHAYPEFRDIEVLFAGFNLGFRRHDNARAFFAGLSTPPRFAAPRGVAKLAKCFVPTPSFVNRAVAYAGHLAATREVGASLTRDAGIARTEQPLYLSRSRLVGVDRVVVNETAFEEILRGAGVRIAHPQEMSLVDQIALFRSHATILGCAGSALHNLMFTADGVGMRAHVFSERQLNRNCLLIDGIVGNASHYARVLEGSRAFDSRRPRMAIQIDIDSAVDYLRDAGII